MAINDVLPLKAARRDAIANLKCFLGLQNTSDLISMVLFTFTMRRHLIRLASVPFNSSRLAMFGWVPSAVCNAWQRSRTQNSRRISEISGPILNRLWTKVHEIFRRCRRSLIVLSNALARVSMSRFVQKIFATKSRSRRKTEEILKFFGPNSLGRTTPTFLLHIVSAYYCPPSPLDKVWLSYVCWSSSAKPGNELECWIYIGWVKCRSNFEPFMDQSSCHFETM